MEKETCKKLQEEEMKSLEAIFIKEFKLHSDNSFIIKLFNSSGNELDLYVTFPYNYPLHSAPQYVISAPWMTNQKKIRLSKELNKISCQYRGECRVYLWTVFIKDFIEQDSSCLKKFLDCADEHDDLKEKDMSSIEDTVELPAIMHGETIKDRKSVFQGHLAKVTSLKQVNQVLEKLKENKKINSAKHNVYAYRIKSDRNGTISFDCNDDGEAKAGPVLLHLLEVLNLTDIVIVVTRWYGGIHLGPLRFKHYGDAAKNLINDLGLVKNEKTPKPSKKLR